MIKVFFMLLLVSLVLAGCSSESSPRSVATKYLASITSSQWQDACNLLQKQSLENLETLSGESCPEALRQQASEWIGLSTSAEILASKKISSTQVEFQTNVSKDPLLLSQEDGAWRVTFFEKE